MQTTFIAISSVLTLVAIVPYLIDIAKGRTKPRIVSWFIWSVLTAIATAASFADHQYASAILTLCDVFGTMTVIVFGLVKAADRGFGKFDVYCLVGAIVGLILWRIFDSPAVAVLASVLIDFIGALPTIKHTWEKPFEETWITYLLSSVGGLFTVLAAQEVRITALAYPVYITVLGAVLAAIILIRHKYVQKVGEPAELREL